MKKIAVLGSTGSIGTQTLEIVRTNQDIKVTALAAGNNIELLEQQIREFSPRVVAVWKEERAKGTERKDPGSGCESTLWNGRIACGGRRT